MRRCTGPDAAAAVERAAALLRARGDRMTGPRRVVIAALAARRAHLTADQVVSAVAEQDASVHRASVYRTLETLSQLGVVQHVHVGHGTTTYHLAGDEPHLHAQCGSCGSVLDLPGTLLDAVAGAIREEHGFAARPGARRAVRHLRRPAGGDDERLQPVGAGAPRRSGRSATRCCAPRRPRSLAFDDDLRALVDRMWVSMHAARGVGLAANQIGVGLVGLRLRGRRGVRRRGQPDAGRDVGGGTGEDEGCLSVLGQVFDTPRPSCAVVTGFGVDGAAGRGPRRGAARPLPAARDRPPERPAVPGPPQRPGPAAAIKEAAAAGGPAVLRGAFGTF